MAKLCYYCGLIMTLGICACKVGPNYCPPTTPVPAQWCGAAPGAVATQPAGPTVPPQWLAGQPLDSPASQPATQPANPATQPSIPVNEPALVEWWVELHDPLLDSLLTRAVEDNLTLRIATARVLQARAQRDTAVAAYFPEVTFNDSYSYNGLPLNVDWPIKAPRSLLSLAGVKARRQLNLFDAAFDASWEIDVFGGISRSVEAATDILEQAEWSRRDALVMLLGEVASSYVQLRGAQRRLEIAYQNIKIQQDAVNVTRERYEAGVTGELDVAQAQAQLSATEATVPSLQIQIRRLIYQLSVLLALPPCTLLDELREAEPIPLTPPEVPVGLPSDLLRRRPDVRAAERLLASQTARVGVAVANMYPVFNLHGLFGTATSDFRHFLDSRSLIWSVGPNMTWRVFQGGALVAQVHLQDAIAEEDLANYELVVLTAFQDVENSLVEYLNDKVRYKSLTDSVIANQRATDISTDLYGRGLTTFLNVLESQRSLFTSQDAQVASQTQAVLDLISLYKALGGGWEPSEPCCIEFRGISGLESHAELNLEEETPGASPGPD